MKKFTLALAAVLGVFAGTRADAGITLGLSANISADGQYDPERITYLSSLTLL